MTSSRTLYTHTHTHTGTRQNTCEPVLYECAVCGLWTKIRVKYLNIINVCVCVCARCEIAVRCGAVFIKGVCRAPEIVTFVVIRGAIKRRDADKRMPNSSRAPAQEDVNPSERLPPRQRISAYARRSGHVPSCDSYCHYRCSDSFDRNVWNTSRNAQYFWTENRTCFRVSTCLRTVGRHIYCCFVFNYVPYLCRIFFDTLF